jgi:FemAB-related protein (PEP-CTERM system-associated)
MPAGVTVRAFRPGDAAAWDAYVRATPDSHFGQLRAWCGLLGGRLGCEERSLIAERSEGLAGVLPLFRRRGAGGHALFTPPGGLLADDADTAAALLAEAAAPVRAGRAPWLELRDQRRRWADLATVEENATLELALAPDEASQWKAFDAKLRNQIRKGEKAGFTVHWGRDQVDAFHRVMLENLRDLGTPLLEPGYYREVLARYGDAATVLVIRLHGEPAGAMFLIAHGGTLADPWASSRRRFLRDCPNQVLYWEALRHGIRRGMRRFDFGRSQWDSSTFRFKTQWGAQPVPLYYQYALAEGRRAPTVAGQKSGFSLAVRAWKKLPLPLAGWIGPRVRRLFPEAL